jgi:hypothetical protein
LQSLPQRYKCVAPKANYSYLEFKLPVNRKYGKFCISILVTFCSQQTTKKVENSFRNHIPKRSKSMEELEITQVEVIEEAEDIVEAEEQAVEDATHDPGARIEETQDFTQAEAVEAELTEVMEVVEPGEADVEESVPEADFIAEAEAASEPEAVVDEDVLADTEAMATPGSEPGMTTPDEPQAQVRDPLTGKGYGEQNQSSESEPEAEEYVLAESLDEMEGIQAQAGEFTPTETQEPQSDGTMADPGLIDGNDPVYQVDTEAGDISGSIGTQDDINEDLTGELDPQRLGPENLPQNEKLPVGMGPNGALFPGGGKLPGGKGGPPQGGKTNGGGPPVGNYGSGSKGNGGKKGKVTYWGVNDGQSFEGSSNNSCEKETVQQSKRSEITTDGNVIVDCGDGTQYQLYWEDGGDIEVSKRGLTLDGATPMPYTGNGSWGEDPDPKTPIGGVDHEAGKVYPVLAGGSSKSGGKTPGDKDGDDDSGHFLGDPNLSGSDDYVPPPDDDIPYHILNQYNIGH